MLTYAFDLLYAIYEEQGYQPTEIPTLILTHNLYGIEIDDRAGALAAFALQMKAREKYRRFLSPGKNVQPNICVLKNIEIDREDLAAYFAEEVRGGHSCRYHFSQVVKDWIRSGQLASYRATLHVTDVAIDLANQLHEPEQLRGELDQLSLSAKEQKFLDEHFDGGGTWETLEEDDQQRLAKEIFWSMCDTGSILEQVEPGGVDYTDVANAGRLVERIYTKLLNQFKEADNFGSLIRPVVNDVSEVLALLRERKTGENLFLADVHQKVLRSLVQADYLSSKYHVVVANPPYMGPKQMNADLKEFGAEHYEDAKTDMYAMLLEMSFCMLRENGISAFVTMHSWMFLSSFTKLREKLLSRQSLLTLAHLGARAFGSISGEIVAVAAFCFEKTPPRPRKSIYFRLLDGEEKQKDRQLRARECQFVLDDQTSFNSVPDSPIAYWVKEETRQLFCKQRIEELSLSDGQNITADNERFVREFWEVGISDVGHGRRWLPYAKGGSFRRWYGNIENVVDWSELARAHYRAHSSP